MDRDGLGRWLRQRRAKSPDRVALIAGARTSTYRELADAADRFGAALAAAGIGRGDRVAFVGDNSPEHVAALFGTLAIGAVFVPVNTRLAPPAARHVVADSGARLVVHDPELADLAATAAGGGGRTMTTPEAAAGSGPAPSAASAPDDPAAMIYTSGTTGRPKGAVLSHGNLTWSAINAIVDYDIVSTDVALLISPLYHVASLGMGLLPAVLKGATVVLEKGFEPGRVLRLVERHGATMLSGVPTTFQALAEHPAWATTDLSTLAKLTCGGSAVPRRVLDAYEARGLSFSQGYGMTETSPGATSLSPAMTLAKQGTVGLPHFFTDVRVVDDAGREVPTGTTGGIEVAGPNVFLGYHGLPDATAEAFTADGWFRTGDLGHLDEDGYLAIDDREKDMIICGGENVYSAEVEHLLAGVDGITGAAVIGVADARFGEVPWAVVTVRDGAVVDARRVRTALAGRLARYKVPRGVVVVDALPRTASGKVRKAELRRRYGTPTASAGS